MRPAQTALAEITVRPAVLLPASMTIVPNATPCDGGDVCSGRPASLPCASPAPPARRLRAARCVSTSFRVSSRCRARTRARRCPRPRPSYRTRTAMHADHLGRAEDADADRPAACNRPRDREPGHRAIRDRPSDQRRRCALGRPVGQYHDHRSCAERVLQRCTRLPLHLRRYAAVSRCPQLPASVTLVGSPVPVNGGGFDVITNGTCFRICRSRSATRPAA